MQLRTSARVIVAPLFLLMVCLASECNAADPLTIERLQQIIESEHEENPLVEALQIYPKAREYSITVTTRAPDGQSREGNVLASEKWVEGRYIVSEPVAVSPESRFAMVVEFDEEDKLYKKYIVARNTIVGYSVGIRIEGTRSVSWIDLTPAKFDLKSDSLIVESHTDTMTTWKSITFNNGSTQQIETGTATVSKPVE